MTVPRGEIYDATEVGVYHCISRCVRRAFLCGFDKLTGRSFEHRRFWVRERLSLLVQVFAIELIAYALMSNHVHSLIRNRPDTAKLWSPEEVARRWRILFPLRWKGGKPAEPSAEEIAAITAQPDLVALYRSRLCSISWFNRCLCEQIARRANREDECTGRFWEGRFKSQRIHDINGLLACSAYIDLNPIRAGSATNPEESNFTSVQQWIRALQQGHQSVTLPKLVSIEDATQGMLSMTEYLQLLDATGRILVAGKGKIPSDAADILTRIGIRANNWIDTATNLRTSFKRSVGPIKALSNFAHQIGKRWLHGYAAAKIAFC